MYVCSIKIIGLWINEGMYQNIFLLIILHLGLREYGSSGEDVSVNAVIIPKNWWAIPSEGRSPEEGYCSPILRNDDRIHRYI